MYDSVLKIVCTTPATFTSYQKCSKKKNNRKTDDAFRILRSTYNSKTESKWNKIADELLIIVAPRNKNVSIAGRT